MKNINKFEEIIAKEEVQIIKLEKELEIAKAKLELASKKLDLNPDSVRRKSAFYEAECELDIAVINLTYKLRELEVELYDDFSIVQENIADSNFYHFDTFKGSNEDQEELIGFLTPEESLVIDLTNIVPGMCESKDEFKGHGVNLDHIFEENSKNIQEDVCLTFCALCGKESQVKISDLLSGNVNLECSCKKQENRPAQELKTFNIGPDNTLDIIALMDQLKALGFEINLL